MQEDSSILYLRGRRRGEGEAPEHAVEGGARGAAVDEYGAVARLLHVVEDDEVRRAHTRLRRVAAVGVHGREVGVAESAESQSAGR